MFSFQHPNEISQTYSPDSILVRLNVENFTDPDGLSVERNLNLTSLLPRIIPEEGDADTCKILALLFASLLVVVMIVHFAACQYFGKSLNHLWSAVNFMQLASHLPLMTVLFPSNATYFFNIFLDFVTFEIFPADSLPSLFDFEWKEPINLQFAMLGYKGRHTVENARTIFLFAHIYVTACIIWVIIWLLRTYMHCKVKCVAKCRKCMNMVYPTMTSTLFYAILIRLTFECYLRLCLAVFVSLSDVEWSVTKAVLYDNVFTVIMAVIVAGLPPFVASFYVCHYK